MTGGELLIYGKFLLTFGVLLGIPIWELWRLRQERRARDRAGKTPDRRKIRTIYGGP